MDETSQCTLLYQDGLAVREIAFVPLPPPRDDFDSCYVFAFHKSGSVLLNSMTESLMREHGIPIIDLPGYCFASGISTNSLIFDCERLFRPRGYCYLGFRDLFPCLRGVASTLLSSQNKILQVRDPRDMLVSLYYSMKYSHTFPKHGTPQFFQEVDSAPKKTAGSSIDDFCINWSSVYVVKLREYLELIDDRCLIIKYEDVIYDKARLARLICDHFQLDLKPSKLDSVAKALDEIPLHDRPEHHIRQAHPGDHKRKLQPQTITILNHVLRDFFECFGYEV